jgi:hypothetical protein
MKLLSEVLKVDQALTSVSRASGAFATSGIYPLNEQRKALAVVRPARLWSSCKDGGSGNSTGGRAAGVRKGEGEST